MTLAIRRISTGLIATLALAAAAACGKQATPSEELAHELDAAAKPAESAIEISPIEQGQPGVQRKAPQPSRAIVQPVARRSPRPQVKAPTRQQAQPQPEPQATVEDRSTIDAPAAGPARAPSSRPQVQPAPPGGYTPMGEIIRRAPFPINP